MKSLKKCLALVLTVLMLMTTIPIATLNVSAWDEGMTYVKKHSPWNNYPNSYAAYVTNGGDDYAGIVLKEVNNDGIIYVNKGQDFQITLSCGTMISTAASGGIPQNGDLHWHYGSNTDYVFTSADGQKNPGNSRWSAYIYGNNSREIQSAIEGTWANGASLNAYRATAGEGGTNEAYGVFKFTTNSFSELNTPGVYNIRLAPTFAMNKWKYNGGNNWNTIYGWGRFDYDKNDWLKRTIPVTVVVGEFEFKKADDSVASKVASNNYSTVTKPANTANVYAKFGADMHRTYSYAWPATAELKSTVDIKSIFSTTIYNGSNSRGEINKMCVCSDGEAGNTSAGVMRFPIPTDTDSAILHLNFATNGFSGEQLAVLYAPETGNANNIGNTPSATGNFSNIFTSFSTNNATSYNQVKNWFGATEVGVYNIVANRGAEDHTLDVTSAVKSARAAGKSEVVLVFAQKSSGNKGNGGWSDVNIYPDSSYISFNSNDSIDNGATVIKEVQSMTMDNCNWVETGRVANKCLVDGSVSYVCSDCGNTKTEVLTAPGHHTGGENTCNGAAVCTVCGETYGAINPENHDWVTVNAKDSTCQVQGWDEYQECSRCHAVKNRVYRDLADHDFSVLVKDGAEPSCSAPGKTAEYKCSMCDETSGGATIDPLPHTQKVIPAVPATCQATGKTEGKECSVCGYIIEEPITIKKQDHKFDSYTSNNDATCAHDGTKTALCAYACGTESTIEDIGSKDAVAHTFEGDGVVTTPATCKAGGVNTITCSVCGVATKDVETAIDPDGHDYEITAPEVPATCKNDGTTAVLTCKLCGNVTGGEKIDATGAHSYTVAVSAKVPATCKDEGKEAVMQCATCDLTIGGETIEKTTDHNYNAVITPPTCEADGYTTNVCLVCGDSYVVPDSTVEKSGHSWTLVDAGYPATCQAEGLSAKYECTACHETKGGEVIEINTDAHKLVSHSEKDATCTEAGWDAYYTCTNEGCDYTTKVEVGPLGHDYIDHDEKAATCEAVGWDAYQTCSRCDYTTYVEIAALNHDYSVEVAPQKDATCSETGTTAIMRCVRCDATTGGANIEINPDAHKLVDHDAQASTCTVKGWNAYVSCEYCDYTTKTLLDLAEHEYTVEQHEKVEATCSDVGSEAVMQCANCDATIGGETIEIDPDAHKLVDHEAKASTCTEAGWNAYVTCEYCDYNTKTELDLAEHEYTVEQQEKVEATCVAAGSEAIMKCANCTATIGGETITINPDAHKLVNHEAKASTCTVQGWDAYVSCEYCDYTTKTLLGLAEHQYTVEKDAKVEATCSAPGKDAIMKCANCTATKGGEVIEINPDAHKVVTHEAKASTCTVQGWDAYETCELCSKYNTKVLLPLAEHQYTVEVSAESPADCENDGTTAVMQCANCDATIGGEVIKATGVHSYTIVKQDAVPSTCTVQGKTAVMECSGCGKTKGGIPTPLADHDLETVEAKAPTCGESGWAEYSQCKNCSYNTKSIKPATGEHNYTIEVSPEIPATCSETGKTAVMACEVCGKETGGKLISTLTHVSVVIPAKEATCTVDGYKEYKACANCGKALTMIQKIAAKGHKYTSEITKEATCQSEGIKTSTCSVCADVQTATIPMTSHKIIYKVVEATCSTDGKITKTCQYCNIDMGEEVLTAYGHHDADGNDVCDDCGKNLNVDGHGKCKHFCHGTGLINSIITKIFKFFWKLFGVMHYCSCGEAHY